MGFSSNFGGDILFDQLRIGLTVLDLGEPMSMHHRETTTSAEEAYARFPPPVFTRYEGWLDSR
jgi:hypothetical protein